MCIQTGFMKFEKGNPGLELLDEGEGLSENVFVRHEW
jgi:hypothetical protein